MKENKLLKSGVMYTIGNMMTQGIVFLTLPIYTRVMSVSDFGSFNLYTTWVGLITIVIGLQLQSSYSIARIKYEKEFEQYVGSTVSLSLVVFSTVLLSVALVMPILTKFFSFSSLIVYGLFFQSYFAFVQSLVLQYFIQKKESVKYVACSLIMMLSNVLLSLILLYTMDNGFSARVWGGFVPGAVLTLYTLKYLISHKVLRWEMRHTKFMLVTSVPLIFHTLSHQLLNQLDRIMLAKIQGIEQVAVYSFGYSISFILSVVLLSFNTAWVPWYFDEKKQQNTDSISKAQRIYVHLAVLMTVGFSAIFPELIALMGGANYADSRGFVLILVYSHFLMFLYTFPVNVQFFYQKTHYIPIGTAMAAIFNFIFNLILIPKWGIQGAALATVMSYCTLLLFHHILTKWLYKYTELSTIRLLILVFAMGVYMQLINRLMFYPVMRWAIAIMSVIGFMLLHRNELPLQKLKLKK